MTRPPLAPYSRTLRILVLGREVRVPANNTLLRCFQYLCPDTVSRGKFCWNHECGNSRFYYRLPGDPEEHKARACTFRPVDGMEITVLSAELRLVLAAILDREPDRPLPSRREDEPDEFPVPRFRGERDGGD